MDQHPIPQDVTGFQFKLIGTMTVKQFGYVASGVILAVILYYLPLHSAFAILAKVILIPILGASGVVVAFVPIDGRPVDVMSTNFVKALFSPNQYVYHRQGKKLSFSTMSVTKPQTAKSTGKESTAAAQSNADNEKQLNQKEEKLRSLLLSSHQQIRNDLDKKEAAFLKTLSIPAPTQTTAPQPAVQIAPQQPFLQKTVQPAAPMAQPQLIAQRPTQPVAPPSAQKVASSPVQPQEQTEQHLQQQENQLEQELTKAKQEEAKEQTPQQQQVAHQKVENLTQQIQKIHAQKQQLEQELAQLKTQLAAQKHVAMPQTPKAQPQPQQGQTAEKPTQAQDPQHVRTVPQEATKKAGVPHVSDTPNVVVGIVKDPRGNVLPGILVEVKDKDGNPVRAFKTNQLGQFASATPLSPGTYTIELEDPKKQQRFDVIKIIANNQILLPLEIISHDAREDLRKQLFAS